ncbi:XrtA/PEP-CTERM system exopolysaccharide export protein [Methylomagnum ishizawai]|uniref:XrtA/PEP-CTERM system exopolysaccharide export protein n=1 Tax=Methylomagnum ishizawai TaxID=1760988 RepID=UPI001C331F99|nr:XrtA/PEP-CTERM system exopolysaccharide export protein [Methylomagnum ishizawai]BBL74295.1 sugar ABC transporter substrate-binding protein [Methylomagnum ishizawai]
MPLTRPRTYVFLVVCLFLLGGCETAPLAPNVEPPTEYTYIIGPGDNIEMFVWGNPEVSRSVPVRPDGKISAPLVEELPASGKTPFQLARDIERELGKYIRNPLVSVIVSGFVGPYSEQVRVVGQAAKPQAVPYKENMSLLDLMILVGGMTEYAAGNRSTIVRTVNGVQQQFRVRVDDLLDNGDISANVNVLPGDVLIIPEAYF